MENRRVYRCHYRAQLVREDDPQLGALLARCESLAQAMINAGELMTAALYRYGRQLFLYYEPLGTCVDPDRFMAPLAPLLSPWPQKEETARWVQMHNIYWHSVPQGEEDWARKTPPKHRRGRIAYLKHESMFRYVYHHVAIVEEGLLDGDKYQSIALHEDVLFSYFEEPRQMTHIRRDCNAPSRAIDGWTAVDPESHFIPLPGSNGQNFLILPPCFALGQA